MKNRVKIKALDFQLDNAQRNKTDNFRDNSKIIVRRGNVFNFKIELSEVLSNWTLTTQCKTQKYKFSSKEGDIGGWSAKSTTVDCTSIWRVSLGFLNCINDIWLTTVLSLTHWIINFLNHYPQKVYRSMLKSAFTGFNYLCTSETVKTISVLMANFMWLQTPSNHAPLSTTITCLFWRNISTIQLG